MNVLFITVAWPKPGSYNLYSDLMHEFREHGHSVYVASIGDASIDSGVMVENGINVLRVGAGNIQRTNKYVKVINSFLAGAKIRNHVYKCFRDVKFDLLIFTTPPITMTLDIIRLKKHYKMPLYLLLKDIWPQDTVDIGGMRKGGLVWRVFRWLEKRTYIGADYIGCMSPASKRYIIKENSYISPEKVEVCPNSQKDRMMSTPHKDGMRKKYGIPDDAVLYIYGGNIGVPQGVDFLFSAAEQFKKEKNKFLLIVGGGTEFDRLRKGLQTIGADNVCLLPTVDKYEYDALVSESDVGLILLHPHAEVPNFPSRLLSYIQLGKPVIAAVDEATDIGIILEQYGCGKNCRNGDIEKFMDAVHYYSDLEHISEAGRNARELFLKCYTTDKGYSIIMNHFNGKDVGELQNEFALSGKV